MKLKLFIVLMTIINISMAQDNIIPFDLTHWEGKIFPISPEGDIVELTDTFNTADFEFIPEKNLLLVPTFLENSVVAYKIK